MQNSSTTSSTTWNTGSGQRTPQAGTLRSPHSALRSRDGFTVIEMLVVIGLIVFLAAILVTTVGNFMGTTREKATQATLLVLDGVLKERADGFDTWADDSSNEVESIGRNWSSNVFGTVPSDNQTQNMIGRKVLFRQQFPQRFSELYGQAPGNDNTDDDNNGITDDISEIGFPGTNDVRFVNFSQFVTDSSKHTPQTESSELLYLMLTEARSFGADLSQIDFLNDNQIQDTDGDGLMEFVDGWGRPLRFYRWPTRLVWPNFPNQFNPALLGSAQLLISNVASQDQRSLRQDPNDPQGLLTGFINTVGPARFEQALHTPETYHSPLIVSPGPDNELALFEPHQFQPNNGVFGNLAQPKTDLDGDGSPDWSLNQAGSGPLNDNITSRNFQPGRQ